MDTPKGRWVGGGGFRVDRERMLDKLARFQLEDPALCVLAWVRSAVASGASALEARAGDSAFELSFDGVAFAAAELQDPYSCLFDGRSESGRRRHELAVGLLAALRLEPLGVTIASGQGRRRVAFRALSVRQDAVAPEPGSAPDTVIRVEWDGPSRLPGRRVKALLNDYGRALPIPLRLDGRPLAMGRDDWKALPGRAFRHGALHGHLALPSGPDEGRSRIELLAYGVRVETASLPLTLAQANGYLNHDGFELNASQNAVQRVGAAWDEAAAALHAETERLLLQEAAEQARRMPLTGQWLLDPPCLAVWEEAMRQPRPQAGATPLPRRLAAWAGLSAVSPERRESLRESARRTRWLRGACARALLHLGRRTRQEALRALWDAPLLLDARGLPLSLRALHEQSRRKRDLIPYTRSALPRRELPLDLVWITSPEDLRFLRVVFPGSRVSSYTPAP